MRKFTLIIIGVIVIAFSLFVFFRYYYVFGEGVKSGELNYLVKKGNVFKTFEGKLIQSGLRTGTTGSVQSYEFEFSVEDKKIAETLMRNSGKVFDLHYKEYHATLPWRGFSKFIVDSIYSMKARPGESPFRVNP
ncbi:hypothetical protein GZH53_19010 [Flavihumibacter sp. R14]|nr:hypothetical protein [Flavihumibacter soli]